MVGLSKNDLVGFLMDIVSNLGCGIWQQTHALRWGLSSAQRVLPPWGPDTEGGGATQWGNPARVPRRQPLGFDVKDFKKS